jgi:hypothetical protein
VPALRRCAEAVGESSAGPVLEIITRRYEDTKQVLQDYVRRFASKRRKSAIGRRRYAEAQRLGVVFTIIWAGQTLSPTEWG